MNKLIKLVGDVNHILVTQKGIEDVALYYTTDGYEETVSLSEPYTLLGDCSDRGWDEEKNDYERTEKEQILWELDGYIHILTEIYKAIENIKDD